MTDGQGPPAGEIPPTPETVRQVLDRAAKAIRASTAVDLWRPSDARVNAEELLGFVMGRAITGKDLDSQVPGPARRRFGRLLVRRVAGEPVAMILGKTEFRGLELRVRRGVFVPRSSSELLAGEAIRRLQRRRAPVAADVATGTGPVALAVAHEVKGARVYGLDISAGALAVARRNARRLGIEGVTFLVSDLLSALPSRLAGQVDVFTIHPPYVSRSLLGSLPKEIRDFEPVESLTDWSDDGLGLVRRLAGESPAWLRRGGWVLVEVSPDLSRRVAGILRRGGFTDARSIRDSLGATRVVAGRLR